jgi:hypothetical protein
MHEIDAATRLQSALGEGVEPGSEDDVLTNVLSGFLDDQILHEASAGQDEARKGRMKSGFMSGRLRHPSSGSASRRPTSSSITCGGASTRTWSAHRNATRTASAFAVGVVTGQPAERAARTWRPPRR